MEECEDAKIKSENRSLKTFLSHGDEDESVANDTTEVRFQYPAKQILVSFYLNSIYIVPEIL